MKIPLIDMVVKYLHMDHVVAAVVAQLMLGGQKILMKVTKLLNYGKNTMKYYILIAISSCVIIYNWLFKVVTKSGVAITQLEDSDASYAIAAKVANSSSLWTLAAVVSAVVIVYCIYKLQGKIL